MPARTRKSARLSAGGIESGGDQSYSLRNQPSPRKRGSRAAKHKRTEETNDKIQPIEEETSRSDQPVLSPPCADSTDNMAARGDNQICDVPEPIDIDPVQRKESTPPESSTNSQDKVLSQGLKVGHSEERHADIGPAVTSATEATKCKENAVNEKITNCDVIKNVAEAYKQESLAKKSHKGMPKSGRPWKTEQTARFSDLRKDKPLKTSWQQKMAQKAEKLSVRKYQQELQDAKKEAILLKKQRREEHQKKKEENQRKSEVVQVIKNPAKLKRMKKKQLRMIEKRP